MTDKQATSLDRRLARLEGQVRGLRRMVQEGQYCMDVLTQVSAARSALDQFAAELATSHVQGCIAGRGTEAAHEKAECMTDEELWDELRTTLARLMR